MKWTSIILGCFVVMTAVIGFTAPVAAEGPETVDRCENAPLLGPGTYSGTLTPEGYQHFRLDLDASEYVTMRMEFDERDIDKIQLTESHFGVEDGEYYGQISTGNHNSQFEPADSSGLGTTWAYFEDGGQAEIWAEEAPVCVEITSEDESAGGYTMSIAEGDSEPPEIVTASEADQLRSENEEYERQIDSLETRLAEANETIQSLRSRDPTIDFNVTVAPADGSESLAVGEKAVVSMESAASDGPDAATLQYNGEQKQVAVPGQAELSLSEAGTHDMVISYGGTEETVSLDVADGDESGDGNSDGTAASGGGTLFGFGLGVAVAAIAVAVLAIRFRVGD